MSQFCNDYYQENYDYFDYKLSLFGPETYTPDADQIYYKEPLTAVRISFGGFLSFSFEEMLQWLIVDINEVSQEYNGIRLVRDKF